MAERAAFRILAAGFVPASALVFAATPAPSTPVAAAASVDEVFACMRASVPEKLRVQSFELLAVDRQGGERSLSGRLFAERKDGRLQVMMRLDAPASVKGASYLVREFSGGDTEDDMYVFLPAVGRVRHISGTFANGSLLGTDFSYAEAKLVQNAYSGAEGRLEAETEVQGRPAHQLSLRPASAQSQYSRIRVWVDQQTCVALKAEFYEGDNKLRKQLEVPLSALVQTDGRWYAASVEMRDLQTGTRTTLKAGRSRDGDNFSEKIFEPRSFSRSDDYSK